jgi:hypothetical protein
VRYFISSMAAEGAEGAEGVGPARFGGHVRGHWNIENGSHWQRDNLWREDGHLMRQHRGAHILSTLRQLALYLHTTQEGTEPKARPISHRVQIAAYNPGKAIPMLRRPP